MFTLQLDEQEKAILLQLLENCITDLRGEIVDTDNVDYKTMLKGRKAVLVKLYEALQVESKERSVTRVT